MNKILFIRKIKKTILYLTFLMMIGKIAFASKDIDQYQDLDSAKSKVVVSLDGGGMRGLISLTFLENIENKLNFKIAEACDLIEGTSTGGIEALGLVCPDKDNPDLPRYSVKDLLNIYNIKGKKIFPSDWRYKISSLDGIWGARYPGRGIREVTEEYFGNTPLSAAVTDIGVVANNINPDKPYIFSNQDSTDWFMKDVAIATSAAPIYLPVAAISPIKKHDGIFTYTGTVSHFVDGGVTGMNNPSVHAYAAVESLIQKSKGNSNNIRVLSVGTGFLESQQSYEKVKNAGILGWIDSLIDIVISTPSQSNDTLMETFLPSLQNNKGKEIVRYWRLDTKIPNKLKDIDNAEDSNRQALTQIAQKYIESRHDILEEIVETMTARYYFKQSQKGDKEAYAV